MGTGQGGGGDGKGGGGDGKRGGPPRDGGGQPPRRKPVLPVLPADETTAKPPAKRPRHPEMPPRQRVPSRAKMPARGSSRGQALLPPDLGKVDVALALKGDHVDARFGPWALRFPTGDGGLHLSDLWVTLIELFEEDEAEWDLPDRPRDLVVAFDVDGPTVNVGVYGTGRYRGAQVPEQLQVRLRALVEAVAGILEAGLAAGDPELSARAADLRGDLDVAREAVAGLPEGWTA